MNIFELIGSVNKLVEINERCHRCIMRNRETDEDDDMESMRLANEILRCVPGELKDELRCELFTIRDGKKAHELVKKLIKILK
jgi:hypothetical protein